ncbi:hypothetical protein B9Z55_004554 [Caenorhabditis nigoni]|uniref:Uncharacterized protein n=1 Tax=Caenorhabditis nigoni TaxID=1611254 RepID=A0A2G5UWZ1_9PELO|nr:hypothetical protein B9Z55_004554 [Caenorhabditis nigoni]
MVPAKHIEIFYAFSWTIHSIFLLIFPWILLGCFGKHEKEEAAPAPVPKSCSDTTSRTSVQQVSSALLQPLPPPAPPASLPEPQKSKETLKVSEEKQNTTPLKSPDVKSKEKIISPKKSMEKAKSPKKETVPKQLEMESEKKKKEKKEIIDKEKTKTEESDQIIIVKKTEDTEENPKTDLESHNDFEEEEERRKKKNLKKARKSAEKPESSNYAY